MRGVLEPRGRAVCRAVGSQGRAAEPPNWGRYQPLFAYSTMEIRSLEPAALPHSIGAWWPLRRYWVSSNVLRRTDLDFATKATRVVLPVNSR